MIYWLLFIALEIWRNYYLIEKRKISPNYGGSFTIRAFFALVCLILTYRNFDPLGDYTTIWQAVPVVVFEVTSFYILFDPILNILRGKPLLYRGKKSGILDPLFLKLGTPYYILFKIFTLIILIISIYAISRGTVYQIL